MFALSKTNSRLLATSTFAVLLAISSTAAIARAMGIPPEGDEDDAPGKTQACAFIGCPNGNRQCGTAAGKVTSGVPPFVGEVSVSWTCYENGPQQ